MDPKLSPPLQQRKWAVPLLASLLLSSLLLSASLLFLSSGQTLLFLSFSQIPSSAADEALFVEPKLHLPPLPTRTVPRLAYIISGSAGDGRSLRRTLRALYHPTNRYVLHLDLEAPPAERLELATAVRDDPVYARFGNVRVVARANLVTYRGPTMVANTLHAAAILLKEGGDWDWFINLSASDYPLVTQDGSAWMMLSHQFIEFCLWGWDNLPRTVLMYYANFLSSPEGYFHTVICNAPEFRNTTVNHDLHFISWDTPPKQHPHFLTLDDFSRMVDSNAPFARKFGRDDPVLDRIDKELLGRDADGFVPGGWYGAWKMNTTDEHDIVRNVNELRPGPGADRLAHLITGLLAADGFDEKHCI
ncbi:beta-glucuronosyltransferase GlcAT14B isoform X2 [Elaeis guineensis]|uniref:Beta-glucuronosyltransferase GlcAT14B isoform X2 n=1 Tax=Elaeis guineensis var. tenera TaxID=51953 RepID=A0A8N4F6B7_ELAGV|nr:beta-glucuronosyltransferase GlcAT14B isoform X2 [Elaeis guineensis]